MRSVRPTYLPPEEPTASQAVLCHPHPLHGGGTMDDVVLDCRTTILHPAGVGVLHFTRFSGCLTTPAAELDGI